MRRSIKSSKVLFLGTYPPRRCGIAAFTYDLAQAFDTVFAPAIKTVIAAMNYSAFKRPKYSSRVVFEIDQDKAEDYKIAAKKINADPKIKLVSIQHEFGIFGGAYGEYLLQFLDTIKKPVVITFHSVIPNPDEYRKKLVKLIFKKANAVIVMANEAVNIFKEDYGLNTSKIFFVPHGVPQVPLYHKRAKEKTNLHNRIVLSTFGLLNKGKGIEYVIEALPPVVDKFPEILYIVIGETHPQIRKKEGESYRNMLIKRVKELGLSENVRFYNKYLTLKEITDYLSATDIYISPSLDENQIVSGTLSYAMGCGKAIISTPSIYAKEVLSEERGILVDFKNPQSIGKALNDVLYDNKLREKLEKNAYECPIM